MTVEQDDVYRRAPGVEFLETEGEFFLVGPDGQSLYHLNRVGSAIWRLLEESISAREVVEILHQAFPETQARQIANDTHAVLDDMKKRGLIEK